VIGLQLNGPLARGVEELSMSRFEMSAAPAAREGGIEMSDLNKTVRDTEADVKETWRKADGDESLGDKVANAGDRLGNAVKDVGDNLHEEADKMSRDAAYEQGRADEASR
jgi:phage-related minor tail protein